MAVLRPDERARLAAVTAQHRLSAWRSARPPMTLRTSAKRSFGMGTERLYCATFQSPLASRTSTPEPRAGPRFGVSRSSSNQAMSPRTERSRRVERKDHALPVAKRGCAYARNSGTVQRSLPSVPRNTPPSAKNEKYVVLVGRRRRRVKAIERRGRSRHVLGRARSAARHDAATGVGGRACAGGHGRAPGKAEHCGEAHAHAMRYEDSRERQQRTRRSISPSYQTRSGRRKDDGARVRRRAALGALDDEVKRLALPHAHGPSRRHGPGCTGSRSRLAPRRSRRRTMRAPGWTLRRRRGRTGPCPRARRPSAAKRRPYGAPRA